MLYPAMSYLVPHRESPSLWNASSISWQETAVHLYEDNLRSLDTVVGKVGRPQGRVQLLGATCSQEPFTCPRLEEAEGLLELEGEKYVGRAA